MKSHITLGQSHRKQLREWYWVFVCFRKMCQFCCLFQLHSWDAYLHHLPFLSCQRRKLFVNQLVAN